MHTDFPDIGFPHQCRGEIDAVLQRIAVGNEPGYWSKQPDEIRILRRLTGGRSDSEVLEVVVRRGTHEARKVIKLGPGLELENEYQAFRDHLPHPSASFVPIEAATPVVLGKARARSGEREAVVYDHAARFIPRGEIQTFEDLAYKAIRFGDTTLEKAIKVLQAFFLGVRNDLYEKYNILDQATALRQWWNHRLGIDAVVAIDRVDVGHRMLEMTVPAPYDVKRETRWSLDIANASIRVDGHAAPGDLVHLDDTRITWRGSRLIADVDTHQLHVEVVADGTKSIVQLASAVKNGSVWTIRGRLVSLRRTIHRERMLQGLGDNFSLDDGVLIGPGARVPDPFAALPVVLESRRSQRITSVIHGDLNPRNILVIDETPCVIDYAMTRNNEPILMDFARLEGCLTRDVLPDDLSWAEHVRLQRLLAAACRLGDEAVQRFAELLASDRAELASTFLLLWAIRRAAREIYPDGYQNQWVQDYLEQLFLFAHLTLKWDSEEDLAPQKLLATAAIASVAVEALSGTDTYRLWSKEALLGDGREIIQFVKAQPKASLHELANLARGLHFLDAPQNDQLWLEFEQARMNLVRWYFRDAAYAAIDRLARDHEVFISVKAYIDLKGQLSARRSRLRSSFEEMLESDELLVQRAHLEDRWDSDEDVLRLIADNSRVVLIGDAGSGKSTVAREWEYRLARSIVDQDESAPNNMRLSPTHDQALHKRPALSRSSTAQHHPPDVINPYMPIVLRAPDLPERLQHWKENDLQSMVGVLGDAAGNTDLLAIGALYIIIDALNELDEKEKRQVVDWISALCTLFPNTPVLACHRQYNYVPGLLPFPIITLQKVEIAQAQTYIYDYLREKGVPDHDQLAHRLVTLLLDDPDHAQVRDLAQTPLFLWMIVEHYRKTKHVPTSRGQLFDTFSNWYLEQRYHEAHRELTKTYCTYEDKVLLLGALGYELVQRRQTKLPEQDVQRLVPQAIQDHWQDVLEEIIAAEMLYCDEKKYLRFLHQSFQEYFAARHFLVAEASDPAAIRQKVRQFGWHDTFMVLLGFAGDATEVVTQVIEEALKVNPLLTARCLRIAEQPDPRLLARFVATQEAILKNAHAGEFAYERAGGALAEYGRGSARACLGRVIIDADAPTGSRIIALKHLAAMPAQARFEPIANRIRQELVSLLPSIFDGPAPVEVQQAAIDAIVTVHLNDLGAYLADLVATGEWPLRRAAWRACHELRLKLTPRQEAAFVTACRERLGQAEEELYRATVKARINALNAERLDILRQLATPPNLPLLLNRRFSFGIQEEVEKILDQVLGADDKPPVEAQEAWAVLTEELEDIFISIDSWLELIRNSDELTALAAAHRLMGLSRILPSEGLYPLFDPDLPPRRLSAVACLVAARGGKNLVKRLEALIRSLMGTVSSLDDFEAFANLVKALQKLNSRLGMRLAAVADTIFFTSRQGVLYHQYFPWFVIATSISLSTEDHRMLLTAGSDDARAAVFELSSYGSFKLLEANKDPSPDLLAFDAKEQMKKLAEREQDPDWQHSLALAAVDVEAVELLPWLISLAQDPKLAKARYTSFNPRYGEYEECILASILRAIGYLARTLLNRQRAKKALPAVRFLHKRYAALRPDEERSIVVGLTTGMGYLGEWKPILTYLGPGEPWMHKAAQNVFEYWVPTRHTPSPKQQREAAAFWISHRLRDRSDLSSQARSTLERIKDHLETQLGRHIQVDEG